MEPRPWWRCIHPLANHDQEEINGVLSASRRFYNRSGYLFGALTAGLALIYPYLITQQLSASLVRTMILILGQQYAGGLFSALANTKFC